MDQIEYIFRIKDFWSALTHFAGFVLSMIGMPFLLIHASEEGAGRSALISLAVFSGSMILLYGASASYHSFHIGKQGDMILKRIDHLSIFILIAGSYTPICQIALKEAGGDLLLGIIWMIAAIGMVFKLFLVTCPRWVSSVIYLAMGWICMFYLPAILNVISKAGVIWLAAGGIMYSLGAVIYALKSGYLRNRSFGNHEIFHCFVLLGSLCHYIMVYRYLVPLI